LPPEVLGLVGFAALLCALLRYAPASSGEAKPTPDDAPPAKAEPSAKPGAEIDADAKAGSSGAPRAVPRETPPARAVATTGAPLSARHAPSTVPRFPPGVEHLSSPTVRSIVADRAPRYQRPPAQQQEQQEQRERQEREQEREQEDAQSKTYYWAPPAADQQSSTEVVHLREMRHGGGQAGARGGRSRPGPRATRDLAARPPGTSPPVTCLRAADSWISQSSSTADADGAGAPDGNAAGGGTSRIRGVSSDDRFGGHRACHRGSDTPRRLTNLHNV